MKKVHYILMAIILGTSTAGMQAQTYIADPDNTLILWQGKKIGGDHDGTINLKSGEIEMVNNKPVGGKIVIDMTSIINRDITNEGMNERLVNHLRSDDFFSVDKYPEAVFQITGSEVNNGGAIKVKGNMTIKGITEAMELVSSLTSSEGALIFTGHIDIDRTLFDVRFGSTKFFANIADKAINDIFTLDYELYLEEME
ncbi:MAG: YceI family protein [Bacteroidales bacterium]|nr:YceI family protein [Bacteroidales bacterium]